jgi:protein-glutamine gamma-glutamyltransferase
MRLRSGLLLHALLLWGWQTGLFWLAVPLTLILVGQPLIRWRWDLSSEQFRRLCQICLLISGLMLIYFLVIQRSLYFLYALLQWLPVVFWPIVTAQAYATQDHFSLRDLLATPQQARSNYYSQNSWLEKSLDLNLLYYVLCFLSASTANNPGFNFYFAMTWLLSWMLLSGRSKRSSIAVWLCMISLSVGIGFMGQAGLHQLHTTAEQRAVNWLSQLISRQNSDPYQSNTRIGDIGAVKLSDEIVFRVAASDRQAFPLLLRGAAYNRYQSSAWVATKSEFVPIQSSDNGSWHLEKNAKPSSSLEISANLDRESNLLNLPNGSIQLNYLPVKRMERNQYGVVRVEGNTGAIAYQVDFNPQSSGDSLPTAEDLQVPDAEKPALEYVIQQLDLTGKPPQQALESLATFFQTHFRYSLNLTGSNGTSPVSAFLLDQRSGHCEYFATATTLLLREAGIPARYATGYSAHEFSPLEGQFVVRGRDAHAWVLVYLDGRWQTFDTTPPDWMNEQQQATSPWQLFVDLWSFATYKLMAAWGQIANSGGLIGVGTAIALLLIFILWRSGHIRRLQWSAVKLVPVTKQRAIPQPVLAGSDSEFYLVEQALAAMGHHRRVGESLQAWLQRLQTVLPDVQFEILRCILDLHYRYRFDPNGLEVSDRSRLKALSQQWLREHRQSS